MSKDKRTYRDRAEALKKAVIKRRFKVKQMAVEHAGGKCKLCGYNRDVSALEFHHLDSSQKDFAIGQKGYTRSWEKVRAEVDKCILVCANCHREIHSGIAQLPDESQVE